MKNLKNIQFILFMLISLSIVFTNSSCTKEGCTNANAKNFDVDAKEDDGSCKICGCTDDTALNFDSEANDDDGSCSYLSDKFIGDWEVEKYSYNGTDLVGSGFFKDYVMDFQADGDFKWEAEFYDSDEETYFPADGEGRWELDGDKLEVKIDDGVEFCFIDGSVKLNFEFDFNSSFDELSLEDECDNGDKIVFEMERD